MLRLTGRQSAASRVGNRSPLPTDEWTNERVGSRGLIRSMDRRFRRWMGRIAALALIAALAASLPAPMQSALAATVSEVETELETLRVGRGDSLSLLLNRAGVRAVDADRISRAIQKRTNLRRMRVGREVRLLFRFEGEGRRIPVAVSVETGQNRFVEATRGANGRYTAHRTTIPLTRPVPLTEVVLGHEGQRVTVRRNDTLGGHPPPPRRRWIHGGRHCEGAQRAFRSAWPHAGPCRHDRRRGADTGGAPVLNAIGAPS